MQLCTLPGVDKELQLSQQQLNKIRTTYVMYKEDVKVATDTDDSEITDELVALHRQATESVIKLLAAEQHKRLTEIKFQVDVFRGDVDVAISNAKIPISDDQRAILQAMGKQRPAPVQEHANRIGYRLVYDMLLKKRTIEEVDNLMGERFIFKQIRRPVAPERLESRPSPPQANRRR